MSSTKIEAGSEFPEIIVKCRNESEVDARMPIGDADWQIVVVYRGQHCPICTDYINSLEQFQDRLKACKISLVAMSADSKLQLESHLKQINVSFPIYYGLSIEQMMQLGLYISEPRSPEETDHVFPEPALFVINEKGKVQVIDIANAPIIRPEFGRLLSGLEWSRENNYPIRGTYTHRG